MTARPRSVSGRRIGDGGTAVLALAGVLAAAVAVAASLAAAVRRAERAAATGIYDPAGVFAQRNGRRPYADALIVLGARASRNGPSDELRARLDHTASLWQDGAARRVLVSGGESDGVDETDVMAAYLEAAGVPGESVAPVRPSQNTRVLLRTLPGGGERYLAVSSPYHAFRLATEARRRDLLLAVTAPERSPETSDPRAHRVRLASEAFALVWYALPQRMTARVRTGPGTLRHVVPAVLIGRLPPTALVARGLWRAG